jgi:predicted ATP-grasp superfamily ATP-dependent carboligase
LSAAALVTDAEKGAVLAACRGLGEAGYRVAAAAAVRPAPAQWSRACRERIHVPDPGTDTPGFAVALAGFLRSHPYDVLLPGTEASLIAVSEHRDRLEPLVRLGLPSHQVIERCLDKVALVEASAAAGLAPPQTFVCERTDDARQAARRLGYPVIAKPARSLLRGSGGRRHQNAVVAGDEATLRRALPELGEPLVIQRYERAGPTLSCSGVVFAGRLWALCVAKYERTWPPLAGPSSFSETIEPPPGLQERVQGLLQRLGWEGIFQVQLIDLGRGRLAALDLNPRIFGSLGLAVRAGANLPAVWCDLLLGRDPPFAAARKGVRYRWEEGDLRHLLWQLRRGRIGAAASIARPSRNVAHAYFRLADPAPAAAGALQAVRRAIARAR